MPANAPFSNTVDVTPGDISPTSEWKKFKSYSIDVDSRRGNKGREIKLCNFDRPHMRAFHAAWWCFFIAFFVWFAIGPLLTEIKDDLNLSNSDIWTSSIAGVGGTIIIRLIIGPYCDKYGARALFALCLCTAAIPTACIGLIHSANDLIILRLFIGIAGGTFVTCEYWTSCMFTADVVGTANALVAGWGNLGAGVTQIIVGSLLFPLFKVFLEGDSERAWRTVSIIPAFVAFLTGVIVYFVTDDCPNGNYYELKRHGQMQYVSARSSLMSAARRRNSWLLAIQYATCFGVELTMNNVAALYFRDAFGQSTESAGAIASMFGWMNLFARGFGGFYSDFANLQNGMKGRLRTVSVTLVGEAIFIFMFAHTGTLAGSIVVMIMFSLFVQAAEGAVYGIVPYVDPQYTGAVTGIVGAGGNVGAVVFGVIFRQLGENYKTAFSIMGAAILLSAGLSVFINIEGESTFFTKDEDAERSMPPRSRENVAPNQTQDLNC